MRALNWMKEWPVKHEWVTDIMIKALALTCKYMLMLVATATVMLAPFVLIGFILHWSGLG